MDAIRFRLARGARLNYLRDWIYGSIDGGVTTFAVVAGVVAASLPANVILLPGFANLVADGFAMAASNYIGTKADWDNYKRILEIERRHIALVPEGEREEIRQLFAAKGFAGDDLERIVDVISPDPLLWARTMAVEEYGHFADAEIACTGRDEHLHCFFCGIVPLISYLAFGGFGACVVATGAVFFCVGAIKSRWSPVSWWRSGLETLFIGMSAAGLAFAIGHAMQVAFHL